ncbi:MAG: competence/damage-inducible protein A, partial [Acidobacteriota bacterium]
RARVVDARAAGMSEVPIRRAAILAVGSELLTSSRVDTNSLFITSLLNEIGIDVLFKVVVGDDRAELGIQFTQALARVDLVVLTGGLGPTQDDVTREVVAEHLGLRLEEDTAITDTIRRRFEARGWRMPEINRRQAMVPAGAVVLPNPNGTAPGLWIPVEPKAVALVPGPPREMKPMMERLASEHLRRRVGEVRLLRRVIKIAGRSESRVEELTQPVYAAWAARDPAIDTTILAAPGQIELHLSARGSVEARLADALDAAVAEIERVLPHDVFSTDGRTLEEVVGDLLRHRGWRIAVAESCTGGLATSRLTDVPGSSAYVERGIVAYSNDAKVEWLGVPTELLASFGAVSEPVAAAMARGIRERALVDVGIGITGIAGPSGGTELKPVGTVCIAVSAAEEAVRTFRFPGNRELVKTFAAFTALDMVRRTMVRSPASADWVQR